MVQGPLQTTEGNAAKRVVGVYSSGSTDSI